MRPGLCADLYELTPAAGRRRHGVEDEATIGRGVGERPALAAWAVPGGPRRAPGRPTVIDEGRAPAAAATRAARGEP